MKESISKTLIIQCDRLDRFELNDCQQNSVIELHRIVILISVSGKKKSMSSDYAVSRLIILLYFL
jgi:hypothetical protein